jgi:hypothetical protein
VVGLPRGEVVILVHTVEVSMVGAIAVGQVVVVKLKTGTIISDSSNSKIASRDLPEQSPTIQVCTNTVDAHYELIYTSASLL